VFYWYFLDLNWAQKVSKRRNFRTTFRCWGKGYGTEALNRVLDFGFDDLSYRNTSLGCAVVLFIGSIKVLKRQECSKKDRKATTEIGLV
jgi:RimJ/RimL family protein N-acetyltransferase